MTDAFCPSDGKSVISQQVQPFRKKRYIVELAFAQIIEGLFEGQPGAGSASVGQHTPVLVPARKIMEQSQSVVGTQLTVEQLSETHPRIYHIQNPGQRDDRLINGTVEGITIVAHACEFHRLGLRHPFRQRTAFGTVEFREGFAFRTRTPTGCA